MKPSICTNGFSIFISTLLLIFLYSTMNCDLSKSEEKNSGNSSRIIDHNCTNIILIPESASNKAKTDLHIAYGHTSHGSQLTSGMTGLVAFANNHGLGLNLSNNIFQWSETYDNGVSLCIDDYAFDGYGASDLGNPNRTSWQQATRDYLTAHPATNVVIWSWCGQAGTATEDEIANDYLHPMNQLEQNYPGVTFVYMTGHVYEPGIADPGSNVPIRNKQIRDYCIANNKFLYDFEDIESYDPDNHYYGNLDVTDNCDYDANGDGTRESNWATSWQASHTVNVDWYNCSTAHSQSLNGNRKAYAAWWLWARLAGWSGVN